MSVLMGTEDADTLGGGGSGADTLQGEGGDDVLLVSGGSDRAEGGAGVDAIDFGNFQASWRSLWNNTEIGGSFELHDPVTGQAGMLSFANVEVLIGSPYDDDLAANPQIRSIFGGGGNDTINGYWEWPPSEHLLRGGAGDDRIQGGDLFDDINGNEGNDIAFGGGGRDWVVGGKDNDELYGDSTPWDYGDEGADIVLGNLGDDTLNGGGAEDQVRGGQGDDLINGEPGHDWLSGDRGADTLTGGAGADIFHSFGDAGVDRVTDFNRAEGDRVQLDPGSTYTVAQQASDTVISITGGAQMILVGVQMTSLTGDWIFVA